MCFNTAAVVIINNSVLRGESNAEPLSKFISQKLNQLNFILQKVAFLPNDLQVLAIELKHIVKQYDIVIVLDCNAEENFIFKAMAKVYNEKLIPLLEINGNDVAVIQSKHLVPENSRILKSDDNLHSIVHIGGLFVLQEQFDVLKDLICNLLAPYLIWLTSVKPFERIFYSTNMDLLRNNKHHSLLNGLQDCVKIKCECVCKSGMKLLKIVISSGSFNDLLRYEEKLKICVGNEICFSEVNPKIKDSLYTSSWYRLLNAIEIIEECYSKYKPDEIFLSFNGGKDCTVLLHLTLAVLTKLYPDYKKPIFSMYVQSSNPFPEQEVFIQQCKSYYNLDVVTISADIKSALNGVLTDRPYLKACLMGTRRTDPFSEEMLPFQMTDSSWPQVMRVCPLLDWHYSDIWDFLLSYGVPYCTLYDQGYTSLGNVNNTIPHPDLRMRNDLNDSEFYLPAYKLLDGSGERLGRIVNGRK